MKYKFTPFILVAMFVFFVVVAIKPEIMMSKEKQPGQLNVSYSQVKKAIRILFSVLALIQGGTLIFFFGWVYR